MKQFLDLTTIVGLIVAMAVAFWLIAGVIAGTKVTCTTIGNNTYCSDGEGDKVVCTTIRNMIYCN